MKINNQINIKKKNELICLGFKFIGYLKNTNTAIESVKPNLTPVSIT